MSKRKRILKKPSDEGEISTHEIEKAVKSVHVAPADGRWIVRKSGRGSGKVVRYFTSKQDAVDYGKEVSHSSRTGMYIHQKNGKVKEVTGYNHTPSKR